MTSMQLLERLGFSVLAGAFVGAVCGGLTHVVKSQRASETRTTAARLMPRLLLSHEELQEALLGLAHGTRFMQAQRAFGDLASKLGALLYTADRLRGAHSHTVKPALAQAGQAFRDAILAKLHAYYTASDTLTAAMTTEDGKRQMQPINVNLRSLHVLILAIVDETVEAMETDMYRHMRARTNRVLSAHDAERL
jgi:hypothetical protein